MARLTISGIAGYNGDYEFDPFHYTNKELHTIKRIAGVRAGEIEAAFAAGDNDLIVAFAVLALERNGKAIHEDALWNAAVGSIVFDASEEEADAADPPALGLDESESGKRPPSGVTSADGSESQENGQSRIGLSASELSAA